MASVKCHQFSRTDLLVWPVQHAANNMPQACPSLSDECDLTIGTQHLFLMNATSSLPPITAMQRFTFPLTPRRCIRMCSWAWPTFIRFSH